MRIAVTRGRKYQISSLLLCLLALILSSTLTQAESVSIQTAQDDDTHVDTPSAPMRLLIGGSGAPPVIEDPMPEIEEDIPDEPTSEEEEEVDVPTFFGEPVGEKFVLVLDRSGSMLAIDGSFGPVEDYAGNIISNPNRMEIVKSEAISTISKLAPEDEFAIVTFGGNVTYYKDRVLADQNNKDQAIAQIVAMQANGATPAYKALEVATSYYGDDLAQLFFLSDGEPNIGGGPSDILDVFPAWFTALKDSGCELICIKIGQSIEAQQFMKALAQQNTGTYKGF